MSEGAIAAFCVNAVVARERRTTLIFQMMGTTSSNTVENATESVADVVGPGLSSRCADPWRVPSRPRIEHIHCKYIECNQIRSEKVSDYSIDPYSDQGLRIRT